MKIIIAITIVFLFSSCTQNVSFNVTAPGIKGGSFFIRNQQDSIVFGANITNGVLKLNKPMMEQPGYYQLQVTPYNARPGKQFDIYVEPGNYNISIKGNKYPDITSTSEIQQELSAYHVIFDSIRHTANSRSRRYNNQLSSKSANALPQQAFTDLINNVNNSDRELASAGNTALIQYIKRYPDNTIAAHLMAGINYESDAAKYYKILKSLSNEARNTDDGKEISRKLNRLMNIMPGKRAPLIVGTTPDGAMFQTKALNKKLYLLEFWKAASQLSRANHISMADAGLMQKAFPDIKDLGMIGVSLDHKRDWWLGAIKEDKLTWPQYADLKGNESLNGLNWNITHLPTYCLLDSKWRIIENDLEWSEVPIVVNRYLQQH